MWSFTTSGARTSGVKAVGGWWAFCYLPVLSSGGFGSWTVFFLKILKVGSDNDMPWAFSVDICGWEKNTIKDVVVFWWLESRLEVPLLFHSFQRRWCILSVGWVLRWYLWVDRWRDAFNDNTWMEEIQEPHISQQGFGRFSLLLFFGRYVIYVFPFLQSLSFVEGNVLLSINCKYSKNPILICSILVGNFASEIWGVFSTRSQWLRKKHPVLLPGIHQWLGTNAALCQGALLVWSDYDMRIWTIKKGHLGCSFRMPVVRDQALPPPKSICRFFFFFLIQGAFFGLLWGGVVHLHFRHALALPSEGYFFFLRKFHEKKGEALDFRPQPLRSQTPSAKR